MERESLAGRSQELWRGASDPVRDPSRMPRKTCQEKSSPILLRFARRQLDRPDVEPYARSDLHRPSESKVHFPSFDNSRPSRVLGTPCPTVTGIGTTCRHPSAVNSWLSGGLVGRCPTF